MHCNLNFNSLSIINLSSCREHINIFFPNEDYGCSPNAWKYNFKNLVLRHYLVSLYLWSFLLKLYQCIIYGYFLLELYGYFIIVWQPQKTKDCTLWSSVRIFQSQKIFVTECSYNNICVIYLVLHFASKTCKYKDFDYVN